MLDLNELERLAKEAPPGPWQLVEYMGWKQEYGGYPGCIISATDKTWKNASVYNGPASFWALKHEAALFIAYANPATVLELISRLRFAEQALAELHASYSALDREYTHFIESGE